MGLEILKKLLECDITVILGKIKFFMRIVQKCVKIRLFFKGVRNNEMSKNTVESYINNPSQLQRVFYETCDVGDMMSVRSFARNVQEKFPKIHLLINNGEFFI